VQEHLTGVGMLKRNFTAHIYKDKELNIKVTNFTEKCEINIMLKPISIKMDVYV
jgi:hypothetical protein